MPKSVNRPLHDTASDSVAHLRDLLVKLRKAPDQLRLAGKWEKTIHKLNREAKEAVRDTDVPEVRELETPQYRKMTRIYQRHQTLVGNLRTLLEEVRLRVRILALKNAGVRELWKSCRSLALNARDPHQIALYLAIIEQALQLVESGKPGRASARGGRQRNLSTARLQDQVKKLLHAAAAEGGMFNTKSLCERLDAIKVPLPESATWGRKCKSWCEAFKGHSGAVSTWISRAKHAK